ncbi:MAG: hypothetical protein Q4G13_09010, partial [Moraxella sp.]|nr:hypothetical protein [Moraxella sp.]
LAIFSTKAVRLPQISNLMVWRDEVSTRQTICLLQNMEQSAPSPFTNERLGTKNRHSYLNSGFLSAVNTI